MPPKYTPQLQGFLQSVIPFFLAVIKELEDLIQEFVQEQEAIGESLLEKSDVVDVRVNELRNTYKHILNLKDNFQETGGKKDIKFVRDIEHTIVETQTLYQANKVILQTMITLQRLWNRHHVTISQHAPANAVFFLAVDTFGAMESEEFRRTSKQISKVFRDCMAQTSQHIEAAVKLLNSLAIAQDLHLALKEEAAQSSMIKADGNCMYRAVVIALDEVIGQDQLATMLPGANEDERMLALRRMVATRVRDIYQAGINDDTATVFNHAIATARRHPGFIDGTTEQEAILFYINTIIATPGPANWGDHNVLQIIAEIIQIPIHVHQAETGAIITINPTIAVHQAIHLLHQGEVHYEVHPDNGYDDMPQLEAGEQANEVIAAAFNNLNGTRVPDEDDLSFLMGEEYLSLPPSTH